MSDYSIKVERLISKIYHLEGYLSIHGTTQAYHVSACEQIKDIKKLALELRVINKGGRKNDI